MGRDAKKEAPEEVQKTEGAGVGKEEEKGTTEEKKEEVEIVSNWDEEVKKFDELNLKEPLLRGIYGYGFVMPSPIQQKGILPLLKKKDTIAQAQSGTGKTATFAIGILQLIDTTVDKVQALVLGPTRELALQNTRVGGSVTSRLSQTWEST